MHLANEHHSSKGLSKPKRVQDDHHDNILIIMTQAVRGCSPQ